MNYIITEEQIQVAYKLDWFDVEMSHLARGVYKIECEIADIKRMHYINRYPLANKY